MSGLTSMGVGELAAAVKARKVSATEVVEAHLSRVSEKDGAIGAFLTRADESARADAKAIDDRLARGLAALSWTT